MTIGLDISSLQGPHRMRGIGYTLINFINNISADDRKKHRFVFYAYTDDAVEDVLSILDLGGLDYELRPLELPRRLHTTLPGRFNLLASAVNQLYSLLDNRFGDSRIKSLDGVDVFLQTDQNVSLPRGRQVKKSLILYDIIPYVLEWDYMWSYRTARLQHSYPLRSALRCAARRRLYVRKLRINCRRADTLLAISQCTKDDFVKYIGVKEKKIRVVPLGVSGPNTASTKPSHHYIATSWGYARRPLKLADDEMFLLYVGGADPRRKVGDLITAFNHLRAQGHKLKLVLAGDIMQGPNNIPTKEIRHALNNSSYLDDIIFMGFITDEERDWLYKHALAFVFPSKYEGFGLPVLEAMNYGTPTIVYPNLAAKEVAGSLPTYVENALEITNTVETILQHLMPGSKTRKSLATQMQYHVNRFTWRKTDNRIIEALLQTKSQA